MRWPFCISMFCDEPLTRPTLWQHFKKLLHTVFWSLFNIQAMFNRYSDRLDKEQPDSKREWLWVRMRFEPLTLSPWFLIRWRLSLSRLGHSQCVSFRSNSFVICRPSPMLVQKMSIPGYGDSDSLGISTSTRLPGACITRPCHGSRLIPWTCSVI